MPSRSSGQVLTRKKVSNPPIPDKVYFRIGEVARLLGVKTYVLRFWESEFPMVAPRKSASNQRVYRRSEVETLMQIRQLLYVEKYSIAGARRRIQKSKGLAEAKNDTEAKNDVRVDRRLKELALELKTLAARPLGDLFRY